MINELYVLPKVDDLPMIQKILGYLHQEAISIIYTSTLPTASTVPSGKLVIYDDGAGTKRIYVRTGKGNIGFVNLT